MLEDLELKYEELGAKHKSLGEEIQRLKAKPTGVWEPEKGGGYWAVGLGGTTGKLLWGFLGTHATFLSLIAHHNVYKTEQLAEKASVLQRRSNLVIQACLNFDPDFEPDWSDLNQVKYLFYYSQYSDRWKVGNKGNTANFGACVSTKEKANLVLEYLNSQEIK